MKLIKHMLVSVRKVLFENGIYSRNAFAMLLAQLEI